MIHIPRLSTFSIVAYDPLAQEWGVATQSKFLAVGAVVPWVQAGAGAVATQSYANVSYGPEGLKLMAKGLSASEALERLVAGDEERARRQVGLVDAQGRAATFTGDGCHEWAGGLTGEHYAVQGNILVSGATVEALARAFEDTPGELADRLVAALAAGQSAGGDRRGQQSAAVLVARHQGGYGGYTDRYLDLRVDDDPAPIDRLKALVELHHLFFKPPAPGEMVAIEGEVARETQRILQWAGYYDGPLTGAYDAPTRQALSNLIGNENFEERFDEPGGRISEQVLDVLRKKFAPA
ncbi:MAG: DUF1028 domain-containing protein [Chloroflexi bacterium]|nr:DUF1028 domain-containing protein [Chloroflexota bacterium]MBU1751423.1 DUF1028 domain-containing protein [Chloroflexota bacterium]MBU1878815.1 DUF1028 domain-containing protein [Chloroflexota bacterium]